ncbi:MAG: class I SAM-dependent methyltransferase [Anaeroplasmataceae bacterium]|nr:class I SAM-dependent methyltransferase [Anaeroplasmataceae bacterium]
MNQYKKFAYYYDEVMSSLDYNLWLEFVEPYLKPNFKILDLACGTGTLLTMLKLKGFSVVGLDLSSEIIEIAKEKAKINHLNIPFYVADMTDFSLNETFDLITCFFDSVNFLKDESQIQKLFSSALKHLNKNGLFIIDVFSKALFQEYENSFIEEDYTLFQINWTTKKINSTTLKHDITIWEGDAKYNESYYEYFHKIKSLKHKGFKLLRISGDFKDSLEDDDERILLVFQAL